MKDLESNNFIQSCLCDEKGFIKAEFLMRNHGDIEILIDESSVDLLCEELDKFMKFYDLELEISSREVIYSFHKGSKSEANIFSNNGLFCDIGFIKNDDDLIAETDFELNILLMGQFLFMHQDSGKYRPHDLGMHDSHVSFLKGCFRGQEVIARTEHLSKKKKEIIPIKSEDEESVCAKKITTLKEISCGKNIFKLLSFVPS